MQDALARSIAQTAADVLGRRSDAQDGAVISNEEIGAHLWFERGFQDPNELISLINHTRRVVDARAPSRPSRPPYRSPIQLSLNLEAA